MDKTYICKSRPISERVHKTKQVKLRKGGTHTPLVSSKPAKKETENDNDLKNKVEN